MMQRKARGTGHSRGNPTLKSKAKTKRHERYSTNSLKNIISLVVFGSFFVWVGFLFSFYFAYTPEESDKSSLGLLSSPKFAKYKQKGKELQKRFDKLAQPLKKEMKHLRNAAADSLPHLSNHMADLAYPPKKEMTQARKEVTDILPLKEEGKNLRMKTDEDVAQHLTPKLPILPIFATIPDSEKLIDDTMRGKPTIAGVVALLQKFSSEFHKLNISLSSGQTTPKKIIRKFFDLAEELLIPFDEVYRGKTIFPVREDGSIFMSLAAFREHLLKETLIAAFSNAKSPDKLFIGAVVQNCFGRVDNDGTIHTDGEPCRTGFVVTGKNAQGRDQVTVSDAPPDKNGIEEFCTEPNFKKYCESGQVRVMYVHEPEAVGPAMARYFASKLWGGETYFVQTDSHLQFAEHWDEKYTIEVKATSNYPKSVLSAYPPGFSGDGSQPQKVNESNGARLCSCEFSRSDIEKDIIRINTGRGYNGSEKRPTQIPFIAAGFFFAHGNFLRDVPFDPLMPWCFMGEEIALSVRAWTSGWDMYAPRKNLISHQYRPGRMGLPKFWEGVNRLYRGSGADNNSLQGRVVQRVKNLIGYADSSTEIMTANGEDFILKEQEHYGMGNVRTLDAYMKWTGIDMENKKCSPIAWCNKGELD